MTKNVLATFRPERIPKTRLFRFKHVIKVPVDAIDTKLKLAYVVRSNYGYGRFKVMMWSNYIKSKRYAKYGKTFICVPKACGYFVKGKCKKYAFHQKGDFCRLNRKFTPNWITKMELQIWQAENPDYPEIDFNYKVLKNHMSHFWFWKD